MRSNLPILFLIIAASALGNEVAVHHFDPHGAYRAEGFPEQTPTILAIAEKPITLNFPGLAADWNPVVHIHRVTSARQFELDSVNAAFTNGIWKLTWTPPETRGPAQYFVRFKGEPNRCVRVESRDPKWLDATRDALAKAEWQAHGLTQEESSALAALGIRTKSQRKATTATLEMRPHQGGAVRRRIVWDEKNPALLVWRPGPAAGDLEARAPRWWISPEALATDHGLIRFLDLFSEPPLNP